MSGNGYTTGTALALQTRVISLVASRGTKGLTIAELREAIPEHHHGTLSGCLSNLHRDGSVALLAKERRQRCRAYVLPQWVIGRETKQHGHGHREAIYA